MKLRKLASVLLAALFIFSTAAVAMAQDTTQSNEEEDTRRSFVGTISALGDNTLQLEIESDEETSSVNITITENTNVKIPGEQSGEASSLTEEYVGNDAVVLAEKADDSWQAIHVVIKSETPTAQPDVGTVVSVEEGEEGTILTIQLPNGEEKTIQLPEDAQVPDVGDVVTAFTDEQEDENVPPMVRGLVKAEEIQDRLHKHLEEVSSGNVPGITQERVQELGNIMENHVNRHMQMLDEVLERVPEQAKEAIVRAIEKASQGMDRAHEAIETALERAGGPPEDTGSPEEPGPE